MENLAVKVIYKDKTIIIGKGIRTEQSILNHLQKRFSIPESQLQLFYFKYQDDVKNLNEAYIKAFQKGKQSVRIKIQLKNIEQKQALQSIVLRNENDKESKKKFSEENKIQSLDEVSQKDEPHVLFGLSKDKTQNSSEINIKKQEERNQDKKEQEDESLNQYKAQQKVLGENYFPLVAQVSEEKIDIPGLSASQPIQVAKVIDNQHQNKNTPQQNGSQSLMKTQEQVSSLLQSKVSSEQSEEDQEDQQDKKSEQSSSGLLQEQKSKQQPVEIQKIKSQLDKQLEQELALELVPQEEQTQQNSIEKTYIYENKLNSITSQDSHQNEKEDRDYYLKVAVSSQTSAFIERTIEKLKASLQNQFDNKFRDLQKIHSTLETNHLILEKKHEELQLKYDDLEQKYQSLAFIVNQCVGKNQQSKQKLKEQKMEKKPQIQGYKKIPNFDPSQEFQQSSASQPQVEIEDIDDKKQIQVGEVWKPQYFLVNTGKSKWPKNVVVVLQNMQTIPIKSLESHEQFILQMKQISILNVDWSLKQTYRLGFYNRKEELKLFGRRFGVNVIAVEKRKLQLQENNKFVNYIKLLMEQKGIQKKDLKKVVEHLQALDINEKTYKQADKNQLANILKFM